MIRAERDRPAVLAASEASQAAIKRENAKHTPGPWKALGLLMGFGYVIKYDDADGVEAIAYIQAYDIDDDTPEPYGKWSEVEKANHDLVLAAPELLEAAIELKDACNRPAAARTRAEAWRKLDAAIAKATGEQT